MGWWKKTKERWAMDFVLKLIDNLWNLKPFTGYRTQIAKWSLGVLSIYQSAAISPDLAKAGIHLTTISPIVYASLMAYFATKITQFAAEHKPS